MWHAGEGAVYWTDIPAKAVHRVDVASGAHLRYDVDEMVGCLALADDGALVAATRRGVARLRIDDAAATLEPIDDDALLDEVTALVERPNVVLCEFEPQFLEVPPECLILTMKANQKYFPLLDAAGALTNKFLVVSNIRPDDTNAVIRGNVRVVRPRLADAKFFFDQDRKRTLEWRVAGLDKVVYHAKLGSLGERVRRVRAIANAIGEQLGGPVLAQQAERAAQIVALLADELQAADRHEERACTHHDREGRLRIHAEEADHDEARRVVADAQHHQRTEDG